MIGARAAAGGWWRHVRRVIETLLLIELLLLGPAALPTVAPIPDQVVEEPALKVKTRSNADGEVVEIHAVTLLVRQEETEVTGDGEEQVVVERWELGESVAELLGCGLAHHIEVRVLLLKLGAQSVLQVLRKDLCRKFAKPGLEHAANGVWVVEFLLGEQVDVKLCNSLSAQSL